MVAEFSQRLGSVGLLSKLNQWFREKSRGIACHDRRRRHRAIGGPDTLEKRCLLSGVALISATGNGGASLTVEYEVDGAVGPFGIRFYRSADRVFGGDTLLDTVQISASADLTPGQHVRTFVLGTLADQVILPGAGLNDLSTEYSIFVNANVADADVSDNTVPFTGVYHAPGKDLMIQGRDSSDAINVEVGSTGNMQVVFNEFTYNYTVADVTRIRVRAHGGDDVIEAVTSSKAVLAHGGAGDDRITGSMVADSLLGGTGDDWLVGAQGKDTLDGGDGSDIYVVRGTSDGPDVYQDKGAHGTDILLAGADGTRLRPATDFTKSAHGIDVISANGFSNVSLAGSSATNTISLAGIRAENIVLIDGGAGQDQLTGSDGNDVIKGGINSDFIMGGLGHDTALFTGRREHYSITTVGSNIVVQDLAPTVNGDDGTDTLNSVEVFRFLDGDYFPVLSNTGPSAVDDIASVSEDSSEFLIDVLANDTDPDTLDSKSVVALDLAGQPDTWQLVMIYGVGAPLRIPGWPATLGVAFISSDGQSIVYSPGSAFQYLRPGQTATDVIVYIVADSQGLRSSAKLYVTVTGSNNGPVASADSFTVARNAAPLSLDVLANDIDPDRGDTRRISSISAAGLLGSASISADGSRIIYSPGTAFLSLTDGQTASEILSYTVSDSTGATSAATVSLTIRGGNQPPAAAPDTGSVFENGAPLTLDVLANDTDDGPGKRIVSVQSTGMRGGVTISADGLTLQYHVGGAFQELSPGVTATDTFFYAMQDGDGAQSTAQVTISVTGVNDAPVAVADNVSVTEDGPPVSLNILSNDFDADLGDSRTLLSLNLTGTKGVVTFQPDGIVEYSAGAAFNDLRAGVTAIDTFQYTISDQHGAVSTGTVRVTVTGQNDAPVAVADAVTVTEDNVGHVIQVLQNDTDPDTGDTRRVQSINTNGLLGTVTIAANGASVSYSAGSAFQELTAGQSQVETFTYTMVDGAGLISSAIVTVTVTGWTDGAKAMPDAAVAAEDGGSVWIPILENDTNDTGLMNELVSIDTAGSPATIELIMIYGVGVGFFNPGFPATHGTLTLAADGRSVIYTAHQGLRSGQSEIDFFRYTIRDSAGFTSTAIVSVTVTGADDAPVAMPDALTVTNDSAGVSIPVLANDLDADASDSRKIVAVDSSGLSGAVQISPDGTRVNYTPGPAFQDLAFGQSVVDTFAYTISDLSGNLSTALVSVTVTGTNNAPIAVSDSVVAFENGTPVQINVLANDSDPDAPFGDTRSLVSFNTAGLQGNVRLSDDGMQLIYSVEGGFESLRSGATATESFSYTIRDSVGLESTATVTVTIHGANDAPIARDNTLSLSEDANPTAISVLANDTDIDSGDTKRIVSVNTAGLLGIATISADRQQIIYSPGSAFQHLGNGQTAIETFTYTIEDGGGDQATATVIVTVIGANEPVIYVQPPAPPVGAIIGSADDDVLNGTTGNDVIYGQGGDDEISGGSGADVIFGGAGTDSLVGDAGNDILSGGSDRDDLEGGAGADTFRYYLVTESTLADSDRIRDFDSSEGDRIDLSQIDANYIVAGNSSFVFASAFSGVAGQLVVETAAGSSVWYVKADVNGDGMADLQIEVRSDIVLTAADFLL